MPRYTEYLPGLVCGDHLPWLQAVEDFDFTNPQSNFFAYATACVRNALIRLLPRDGLLSIHRLQFWKLAQQGRLKEWDRSQPLSLDMADENEQSFYVMLAACSPGTPVASDEVHVQVETLLGRLSPHERTVLCLFYGLDEADGSTLNHQEIAALLGVTPGAVKGALRRAFHKLRAAPKAVATVEERHQREAEKHAQREARHAAQEASLEEAYARLEAQGCSTTLLRLAQEAQVGTTPANAYLCRRWGTIPQRLQRAYTALVPTRGVITVERLARAARVGERAASDFLQQKQYGKSVGRNAPGMFLEHLRRTVASTGGTLSEFPTRSTKLSQYCHGCQSYVKKPLSQRWHHCTCGIGPVQRDLYSAFLVAHLDPLDTIPSIAQDSWESADLRLLAAVEVLQQRAKEGQALRRPRGHPPRRSASARKSRAEPTRAGLPTR